MNKYFIECMLRSTLQYTGYISEMKTDKTCVLEIYILLADMLNKIKKKIQCNQMQ